MSEFSLVRIFSLPEASRLKALDDADAALLSSFGEESLRDYVSSGNGGGFVKALRFDRSLAVGRRNKRLLTDYYLRTCGRRYVLQMRIDRIKTAFPFRVILSAMRGREEKDAERKREAVLGKWELDDREDRKRAYLRVGKVASGTVPDWDDAAEPSRAR